jgi:hypothetical protein
MITGYNDNFNRTVVSGFGTATSGQAYTVNSTASQFNVVPSEARILPTVVGDRYGYVDRQTSDIDITGQVALSAIPATNLMTVGFVVKRSANSDYYNATMMVAAGGAVSLRFSKVVASSLSTITTVATGITYVANTFYNLRVAVYWSNALQANVLQSKLWAIGAVEPGGWMVSTTDASHTQYTAGTTCGPFARDEAASPGAVTAKIQNVAVRTYGLPVPSSADTMCADPDFAYPKQTALESMADAIDVVSAALDPFADLAALFPRVRVSASNFVINSASTVIPTWTTTEFNVGTDTDLGYNSGVLSLPAGIWLVTFEIYLDPSGANDFWSITAQGGSPAQFADSSMRTNASQPNMNSQGGSGHVSCLVFSPDPENSTTASGRFNPNTATNYTIRYAALSAIKISDYFA